MSNLTLPLPIDLSNEPSFADTRAQPLPGYRLRRVEMLNWGTFHGKVSTFFPGDRWTLLVGENGSGKSTAVDAIRTLLVPPRLLNYNDASGEQKRRDRTRRSYVRGTWATRSAEDSAAAIPQNLRDPGEFSILLGVFANQLEEETITLVQILWELNEKIGEIYAITRHDRSIREHLADLGQSRELKKTLRQRGFEVFDSFTAYAEVFRSRMGIPNETALEVFNQAIGVKEVTDINPFIRKHLLEGSDVLTFVREHLRPHFHELDMSWKAIERAERQIEALAPIASCYGKIQTAETLRQELESKEKLAPIYYAHRHHALACREADTVSGKLTECQAEKTVLEAKRKEDESERDAKLQEIAADKTEQSIQRIDSQLILEGERFKTRKKELATFTGHMVALNKNTPVEASDQFLRIRESITKERPLIESNQKAADQKRVEFLTEQQTALSRRGEISEDLKSLRTHRVLIPREFVTVREAIVSATGISALELPFAGELLEIKSTYREWTGAIERLLHAFGVSMLVPEKHYLTVANFINTRHLGIRFTFHCVPSQTPVFRAELLSDAQRVPGRLDFREEHTLITWVKSEIARRFSHSCCDSVQRLRDVEYGITREGMIRDGATRHTKDDRRAVTDASNYVLGWSLEEKIKALTAAFEEAENRAIQAAKQAKDSEQKAIKLTDQLNAIDGVLLFDNFEVIDTRTVQKEITRLTGEKQQLESSSKKLQTLRQQLETVKTRLENNYQRMLTLGTEIRGYESAIRELDELVARLEKEIKTYDSIDLDVHADVFRALQETGELTLNNIDKIEAQVGRRLTREIKQQNDKIHDAEKEMLPHMSNYLRDYPEHSINLAAEARYAADFTKLRDRIEGQELKEHKLRFEGYLGTNLVGDMAMFSTKLDDHDKNIERRIKSVNESLRKIAFTETTHVKIRAHLSQTDEIRQFRAEVKECLSGGLYPSHEDRLRIFGYIRNLIAKFEKDDVWTGKVTDVRNWYEFGAQVVASDDGREVDYLRGSSGKSGGQKAILAFTILAASIASQYGLLNIKQNAHAFRLVIIDEAFARTDEANSHRALDLFKALGLQLVIVNPFDAKSRIVEDYVDSFHIAANPESNSSKLRRASRAEYEAARENSAI